VTQPPEPRTAVIDGVVFLVSVDALTGVVGEALPWVGEEDVP
jgi:hypothetical protein